MQVKSRNHIQVYLSVGVSVSKNLGSTSACTALDVCVLLFLVASC